MGKGCSAHKKGAVSHQSLRFDEFFESGMMDDVSPFLTSSSRSWARNLTLKSSILAAILLTAAFALSYVPGYLPLVDLLLVMVYFFSGVPALIDSVEDLVDLDVNIDVLMTLAAFSSVLIGSPMEGALLLVLFDLAGSIESTVTGKTHGALQSLHKLAPNRAHVLDESGRLLERSVHDVKLGTTILVKAGEIVPLDGKVIDGSSFVNLVHLTGESKPMAKKSGDTVEAGARTIEGALTISVTHTSGNSTLSRIITLITEAHEAQPALQRWFDRLSRRYALTVIGLAALFSASLPYLLGIPLLGTDGSIYRSLAFLIAASPCALIIALPTAYLSAISSCAWSGILLKGGVTLDAIARCSVFAFDKTGTLTTGNLQVERTDLLEGEGELAHIHSIARALEQRAKHPIAKAICTYAEERGHLPASIREFKVVPGGGVEGVVKWQGEEKTAYLGSRQFIEEIIGRKLPAEKGGVVAFLLIGTTLLRYRLVDEMREGIAETLANLRDQQKVSLMMLTGDNRESAEPVAKELKIDNFQADLQPQDKLRVVTELADDHGLIMVGDGINDAPSLARATVGISMGAFGSATAIEASDVVLLHDNIERLGWLVEKARKTKYIVRQNLILAAGIIVFTSIPAVMGWVPLGLAVVLHEGGTVLVGLNGLRLLRR